MPARGGPLTAETAADVAVDLFAAHPTVALTALVVLVVAAGWVLISFAQGFDELWVLATDAVARRWPRLTTPGARWRLREQQARAQALRRDALQWASLMTLLRLTARR